MELSPEQRLYSAVVEQALNDWKSWYTGGGCARGAKHGKEAREWLFDDVGELTVSECCEMAHIDLHGLRKAILAFEKENEQLLVRIEKKGRPWRARARNPHTSTDTAIIYPIAVWQPPEVINENRISA
jgi:hypothetical protein